jgi:uncharacterized protein (DUF433 family)
VFLHVAEELGEEVLAEILSGQQAFPAVLLPYLTRVDYASDSLLAERWHIAEGVVIDPDRLYGKPILTDWGVATAVLEAAFRANGCSVEAVADWYALPSSAVEQAVMFERALRRDAA